MTKIKAPKIAERSTSFEMRAAGDDGFTMEGYGAVFDTPTRIDSWEGKFDEVLSRGSFTKTLSERKPVLQFDHGRDGATGSVPIGAINEIREDSQGLFVSARLHDNARVEPIRQAIDSGAIDGMSFRFRVIRDEWDESGDIPLRTIREVELFEVGPVVFPAYASTSVGVRSLLADISQEERIQLLAELSPDAASSGTSEEKETDAAPSGTSGPTSGERAAFLRSLELQKVKS
ncbi:HK97 family phage prohead protease [Ilumatobacter sp.]|uniref:HK97 family phage prohead protease n=1 Tax=Ilumatobacter sp. TaxID=1967498 RepID=UPI00375339C8